MIRMIEMRPQRALAPVLAVLILMLAWAVPADVDSKPSSAAAEKDKTEQLPPSTNPAGLVIYPSKDQDTDQQMKDQLESYNWATEQTDWDPYAAYDVLVQKGYVAAQTAEQAQGGLIRGAGRGALVGVAIGAIAGDAGKGAAIGAVAGGLTGGMRSRRSRQAAQSAADQAIQEFNNGFETWNKHYVASLEGRGYIIK
jgi:hypothetical protein